MFDEVLVRSSTVANHAPFLCLQEFRSGGEYAGAGVWQSSVAGGSPTASDLAAAVEPAESPPGPATQGVPARIEEWTQKREIFDEVITGFRLHPGGAQAWFGVPRSGYLRHHWWRYADGCPAGLPDGRWDVALPMTRSPVPTMPDTFVNYLKQQRCSRPDGEQQRL